jgi:hypothetical protein
MNQSHKREACFYYLQQFDWHTLHKKIQNNPEGGTNKLSRNAGKKLPLLDA